VVISCFGKIFNTRSRDLIYGCILFFNCPLVSDTLDKRKKFFLDKYCMSDNLLCKIVSYYVGLYLYMFVHCLVFTFNLATTILW